MSGFIFSFFLLAAEHGGAATGGFAEFWHKVDPYLNFPGFEAWRFINLAIFVTILVYLLKKPLSEAFKAKREAIRAELIRAEEEKQAALAQLTSVEARLARLESESVEIVENAKAEAESEKDRIIRETEEETKRLRAQAESELERKAQQVRLQLRRFSAEESIARAEEKIKAQINAEKDVQLVRAGIQTMGGLN